MKNKQTAEEFNKSVEEFLRHSNYIEKQYREEAFIDAKKAWNFAFANKDEKIGIQYILKIHGLLMKNIYPEIAGKFRDCDVFIGGERKAFLGRELIEARLHNVYSKMNRGAFNRDKTTKETHIEFEDIHPFVDGNGRVGRILYNIHRLKLGLPIHIIHEGDEQMEYYKWFKQI
ncbi:MAG: Fic family protein [Candidatus Pacearchaeota archaeon]|jgi:Fic family protein